MLKVRDLICEIYLTNGKIRTANNISFQIKQGETLGLVGESGSGKTQTALSLIGLSTVYPGIIGGEIVFNFNNNFIPILRELPKYLSNTKHPLRKDLSGWQSLMDKQFYKLWGKHIAIIFQDPQTSLNPFRTVFAQMNEAIRHTNSKLSKDVARDKALFWLSRVKINNPAKVLDSYPFELSGGMAQRVMIAIALASHPDFIILDEPTTGLDVTTQASIIYLLKEIKKEQNITQLLITHDLGLVAHLADRVAVMYAGHILEIGPAEKVLDKFARAKHPYSEGLLAAFHRDGTLKSIENDVPNLLELPSGCPFHPRCPYYLEQNDPYLVKKCPVEKPALIQEDNDHHIACWRYQ